SKNGHFRCFRQPALATDVALKGRMATASIEKALWILGVTLIATYGAMRASAEVQRQDGIAAFTQARLALHTPRVDRATSGPDQSAWSAGRIRAYASTRVSLAPSLPDAV